MQVVQPRTGKGRKWRKKKEKKDSICGTLNPRSVIRRSFGYASSQSDSTGSGSVRSNFYDPIADNQEPEVESSDATTAVLQVEEITVQESVQPAIIRTHSNESHDDETGMVDEPINKPAVPAPGESQEQPTLGDTESEPAKEVNNKSSDEEDFPGASSE